jgi:hypothetical protein
MFVGRISINGYHRQILPQIITLPAKSDNQRQEHGSLEATNSRNGKRVRVPSSGSMEFVSIFSLVKHSDMLMTD